MTKVPALFKSLLRIAVTVASILLVFRVSMYGWMGSSSSGSSRIDLSSLKNNLMRHVKILAADIGIRDVFHYKKLQEAELYVRNQLQSYGYSVELQEYQVYNDTVRNIIATKTGTTRPEEIVVVGAHYDSCGNPGADDNASGIAGLLETARFFAKEETSRTVKFIAFVNEEPPFFKTQKMGSLVYAKRARKQKENIKVAIVFEMLGYYSNEPFSQTYPPFLGPFYPNRGNFIAFVGNFGSASWVRKALNTFKKHSSFPAHMLAAPGVVPGVDFSDHWSFWQQGFPGMMITDTAFYRYAHYHGEDTPEKLDYDSMARVVQGMKSVIREFAG